MEKMLEIEVSAKEVTALECGETQGIPLYVNGLVRCVVGQWSVDVPVTCYWDGGRFEAGDDAMDYAQGREALAPASMLLSDEEIHSLLEDATGCLINACDKSIHDEEDGAWYDELGEIRKSSRCD